MPVAAVDALVTSQRIHVSDEWGTTETGDGSVPQALPLYSDSR